MPKSEIHRLTLVVENLDKEHRDQILQKLNFKDIGTAMKPLSHDQEPKRGPDVTLPNIPPGEFASRQKYFAYKTEGIKEGRIIRTWKYEVIWFWRKKEIPTSMPRLYIKIDGCPSSAKTKDAIAMLKKLGGKIYKTAKKNDVSVNIYKGKGDNILVKHNKIL